MPGVASRTIETVSVEAGQVPKAMLQTNVLVPTPRFSTNELGSELTSIVPAPEINVQIPVPTVGGMASRLASSLQTG